MMRTSAWLLAAWLLAALLLAVCPARVALAAIAPGDGSQTATVAGTTLTVFTYRPAGCAPRMLLLVFHGVDRNADTYRDDAKPLADRVCALVVAPLFDKARFPRDLYQYGGTAEQTPGARTIDLVPGLIAWARGVAGATLPVVLLGHSAGAQFIDRVAAFVDTGAVAIIVANPSTWVLPTQSVAAPFGLGGGSDASLRAYLARPITVLLGEDDVGSKHLAMSRAAMAQGANRHARGEAVFRMGEAAARAHGWAFGWALAEVPGVGHDARRMFASEQAIGVLRNLEGGR